MQLAGLAHGVGFWCAGVAEATQQAEKEQQSREVSQWNEQPLVIARGPGEVDWWSKLLVHVAWVLGKANDVNVDNVVALG